MKKILLAAVAFLTVGLSTVNAQTPRYGTAPNQDKSYRSLSFNLVKKTDAVLVDTFKISPNVYNNNYQLTLTDTCVVAIKSTTDSRFGDQMTFIIENTAGSNHFVYFLGTADVVTKWRMASAGTTITPAASKGVIVKFEFNGTYWYEVSRCVQ